MNNLQVIVDDDICSINPNTLIIETRNINKEELGDIYNYKDTKINLTLNSILYQNLLWHYSEFQKHKVS